MKSIISVFMLSVVLITLGSCESSPERHTYDLRNGSGVRNSDKVEDNGSVTSYESQSQTTNGAEPKSWRQELPGGGHTDFVQESDGTLYATTVRSCRFCGGSGICSICAGNGGTYGRAYGGMFYPCRGCGTTGRCGQCNGKGEVEEVAVTQNGVTRITSSNGYSAVGGSGGTLVTDPNGRTVGVPSGSGGNYHESYRHDYEDDDNKYVEEIVPAPNYTGEPDDEWCDKCHKYMYRHSHIRKRVY